MGSSYHQLSFTEEKEIKADLLDNASSYAIGVISDSSFINADLFKEHANPTQQQRVLLNLDLQLLISVEEIILLNYLCHYIAVTRHSRWIGICLFR